MTDPRRVRILSLTWAEDHYTNAQQVNARDLAARLDPSAFEVTLLSDGAGPASILGFPHVRAWRLRPRLRALSIFLRLLARGFDLLLYPGPGAPEALWLRLPRFLRGPARVLLPVEGDVRQLEEVPQGVRRRVDRLFRRADAVFPITEHVAETLQARCGRIGEVVPVGVDVQVFRPRAHARRPGPLRVLSVGTVKAWKRPELARLAARALGDVSFRWIGDGDLLTGERSGAPPNLEFSGSCSRDLLPEAYRDADVLLHPSRMEGLPKVILEALASGLPVVAFDDYQPRFLSEAGAGLVVAGEADMLDALRRLLADEPLRVRMGEAARRVALEFSWDVVAARWAGVFKREAALARGPRASLPST